MDSVLISGPLYNVKYLLRTCNAYKLMLGFKSGKQMRRYIFLPLFSYITDVGYGNSHSLYLFKCLFH